MKKRLTKIQNPHRKAALDPKVTGPNEIGEYTPMMIALEKIKKGNK